MILEFVTETDSTCSTMVLARENKEIVLFLVVFILLQSQKVLFYVVFLNNKAIPNQRRPLRSRRSPINV